MLGDPTLKNMTTSKDASALELDISAPVEPYDAFISVKSKVKFPVHSHHSRPEDLRVIDNRVEVRWGAWEIRRRPIHGKDFGDELDMTYYSHDNLPEDEIVSQNSQHLQNLKHGKFGCLELGIQSSDLSSTDVYSILEHEPGTENIVNALKSLVDRKTVRVRAYFKMYLPDWSEGIKLVTKRLSDTNLVLSKFMAKKMYNSRELRFMDLPDDEVLKAGYDLPQSFRFRDIGGYLIHQFQAVNMEYSAIETQCTKATEASAKLWLIPEPSSVNEAGIPGKCWAIIVHPNPDLLVQYLTEGSSCILAVTAKAAMSPGTHQHWRVQTIAKSERLHFATVVAPIDFTGEFAMPKEWSNCLVKSVGQLKDADVEHAEVHVRPPNSAVPTQQILNGLASINKQTPSVAARDFKQILVGRRLDVRSNVNWYESNRWSDTDFKNLTEGLQARQLEFMEGLKSMPGSLAAVKGPPGTGKTTAIRRVTRSALIMGKKIAVGAASNAATNILALICKAEGAKVCRLTSMDRALNKLQEIALRAAHEYQSNNPAARVYKVLTEVEDEGFNGGNELLRDRIFMAQDDNDLVVQYAQAYLEELDLEFATSHHPQESQDPSEIQPAQPSNEDEEEEEDEEKNSRKSVWDRLGTLLDELSDQDSEHVSEAILSAFNIAREYPNPSSVSEEILKTDVSDLSEKERNLLSEMRNKATKGKDDARVDPLLLEEQPESVTLKHLGLSITGEIPPDLKPKSDLEEVDFLRQWRKLITQGFADTSTGERRTFIKAAEKIVKAAIKQVDVVAGILGGFTDERAWLSSVIDLSIADEAGQALEAEVVAFFAVFIDKPKIMMGDDLQLQPTVITRSTGAQIDMADDLEEDEEDQSDDSQTEAVKPEADEDEEYQGNDNNDQDAPTVGVNVSNPLARQLQLSILRRISVYFPYTFFNVQFRCVPQIADLFRDVVYRGQLKDHPSTAVAARPEAQKFQAVLRKHWGLVDKSVLVLDVSQSEAIREPGTKSKINPQMKDEGLKVLKILEAEGFGEIQAMSPYRGQKRLYVEEFGEGTSIAWTTVDGSQGSESGIIFLDLTATNPEKAATAFVRMYTRLNVALSRAVNGLVIIGSSAVGMMKRLPRDPIKLDASLFYDYLFTYAKEHGFLVEVEANPMSDSDTKRYVKSKDCNKCGSSEHMQKDCPEPDPCGHCKSKDHTKDDCPLPWCGICFTTDHAFDQCEKRECKNCNGLGHIARDCPDRKPQACFRCLSTDHRIADCPEPYCTKCRIVGHVYENCPQVECRKCKQNGHLAKDCPMNGGKGGKAFAKIEKYCDFCKTNEHSFKACKVKPPGLCPICKKAEHSRKQCPQNTDSTKKWDKEPKNAWETAVAADDSSNSTFKSSQDDSKDLPLVSDVAPASKSPRSKSSEQLSPPALTVTRMLGPFPKKPTFSIDEFLARESAHVNSPSELFSAPTKSISKPPPFQLTGESFGSAGSPPPDPSSSKSVDPALKITMLKELDAYIRQSLQRYNVDPDDDKFLDLEDNMRLALDNDDEDGYVGGKQEMGRYLRSCGRKLK